MKERIDAARLWLLGIQEWEENHQHYKKVADLLQELQSRLELLEKIRDDLCRALDNAGDSLIECADKIESLEQENLKVYHIGAKTEELVFRRNGIQNVADMQAVFDAVEGALESMEMDAARYRWMKEHDMTGLRIYKSCRTPEEIEAAVDDAMKG